MAWNDLTSGQQFGYGSLIAQGISNTIQAFGSFGITRHQNAIAQSQANIARLNAQMMEWQAQSRLHANTKDQVRLTMQAGQTKASQRAALAANGIAVGEGSAAELQTSTDIIKEIDSNQMTANARREAWGMRMQAAQYEGQALMAEAQKKNKWLLNKVQLRSSIKTFDLRGNLICQWFLRLTEISLVSETMAAPAWYPLRLSRPVRIMPLS